MSTPPTPGRSLARKLTEVMAAIARIQKHGRNTFHNYDYATEADIVAAIRGELAQRCVLLVPSITGESRHSVGDKGSWLTVLEMEMEFLDGESGESVTKPWRGYGTDKEDKGGYKAMTGGERYFLLKTFLIPTGDDPEVDEQQPKAARRAAPAATRGPRRSSTTRRSTRGPERFSVRRRKPQSTPATRTCC